MPGSGRSVLGFFLGPSLPGPSRHTYRRHMAYALLDAVAKGILANAPLMALEGMGSPDWQLALQLSISSVGMFLLVWLGGRMASSRKKPFFLVPGLAYAAAGLLMAVADDVVVFLVLLGLASLFDVVSRPALTAIIRLNYPATHRGAATGEIRKWFSLVFLATGLVSAWTLDLAAADPIWLIKTQMVIAAVVSAASMAVFATIRVNEDESRLCGSRPPRPWVPFVEALGILRRDARFRRYLVWAFVYASGGLLYVSFVPAFLADDLDYGYTSCTLLTHTLPSLVAFFTTGDIGRWIDRVSTWKAWGWIRIGWGLDPLILAATPLVMTVFPPAVALLPVLGRVSRGSVMGASWILWWQVTVNHFAPPGGDTTRYMGIILFMNGLARLVPPLLGAALLTSTSIPVVFLVGGGLILLTAGVSFIEHAREKSHSHLSTMAEFEDSFGDGDGGSGG